MTTTTSTGVGTSSSVSTLGGSTFITGTASGLDTQSLIAAAVAQKTAPADTLDAKVTANKAKIASYQQLQTMITALSTAMTQLAAPAFSSVGTTTTAFQNKTVSLTSSDGSTAGNYIAASADADAASASYKLQVTQLAASQKVASNAMDQTTALNYTGSFTLQEGGGPTATINVTPGMTLSDLASAINASSSTSGVSASIIKDSTSGYRLVLSANDTNQPITATATSGEDVLGGIGLTASDGSFSDVLQAAQPAILTLDGSQITSDSNNVTDAVSGVSLSLLNTTPAGTTVTLAVGPDYSAVKSAVTDFITAYNTLRDFISSNQVVAGDGTVDSSETLFADSLLRSVSQQVGGLLSTPSASATGSYSTLADLGVTVDEHNDLQLSDENTLDNALLGNLSQVASMFQSTFTPSDPSLKLLQNTSLSSFNFKLDVTATADGTITGAAVNGDASAFTVSGNRIVGAAGSIYAGLSFALVTSGDSSIQVNIQPGFANQMTNFASEFGDPSTGLIEQQIDALTTQDTDWSTQSTQIRSDADTYQTTLINKYSNMETEVSAAQLVQAQIKAILDGASNNS
jgi:flagellar hook-associated protein 2